MLARDYFRDVPLPIGLTSDSIFEALSETEKIFVMIRREAVTPRGRVFLKILAASHWDVVQFFFQVQEFCRSRLNHKMACQMLGVEVRRHSNVEAMKTCPPGTRVFNANCAHS